MAWDRIKETLSLITKEGRKRKHRRIFQETTQQLLKGVMSETDWREILARLWHLANSKPPSLPKTIRRPEDVKLWLFTICSILEKITQEKEQTPED